MKRLWIVNPTFDDSVISDIVIVYFSISSLKVKSWSLASASQPNFTALRHFMLVVSSYKVLISRNLVNERTAVKEDNGLGRKGWTIRGAIDLVLLIY